MKHLSISKIAASNPNVARDMSVLEEGLAAIRKLREAGIAPSGYTLAPPFQRIRSRESSMITISFSKQG